MRHLLKEFEEPSELLKASEKKLQQIPGIGAEMARSIRSWENLVDLAEEKRRIAEHDISLLTLKDNEYPAALREIHDPPFLLYVRGHLEPSDAAAIGIVGSRRMTHYGREQARKLGFQLARAGFTIISGLARGIDTAAHEAALAAEGRTVAVLGSGIGNIYPPENEVLADRIVENGAVILWSKRPHAAVLSSQQTKRWSKVAPFLPSQVQSIGPRRKDAIVSSEMEPLS
jgi:DNA processing protein